MANNKLVFVYGSLRSGLRNHDFLGDSAFLGEFTTKPEYTMYSICTFYPGVVEGGKTAIIGEVYSVSNEVFADLDQLEGHPTYYFRRILETPYGIAWIYILNKKYIEGNIISSGDWKKE